MKGSAVGLFSGKLMSDRKAKKLADARAQLDAAFAANPDAVRSLPEIREYSPAELEALAGEAELEQKAMKNLHKHGVEGPAVMHSMRPTDVADLSGGRKFEFDVSIQLASGASHRTQISQHMLPWQVNRFAEGRPLTVKYDADEPDNAILADW